MLTRREIESYSPARQEVTVQVLRPFFMRGEILAVGDELKIAFVDARYLESTHKARIVSDPAQPETEVEPVAEQRPVNKKGTT